VQARLAILAKDKNELLTQLNESDSEDQQGNITLLQEELKGKLELKENAEKELILARDRVSEKENKLRERKRLDWSLSMHLTQLLSLFNNQD